MSKDSSDILVDIGEANQTEKEKAFNQGLFK